MTAITTKDGTQIYYKDWGKGQPIIFSHGWPLTADDWNAQMLFFGQHGYRAIARDRRGRRRSLLLRNAHSPEHFLEKKIRSIPKEGVLFYRPGKPGDLPGRPQGHLFDDLQRLRPADRPS